MAELDQERIERLTTGILLELRENYLAGGLVSQDRVFEALNALAASAAIVIHGADGKGGKAHKFFNMALERQFGGEAEPSRDQ